MIGLSLFSLLWSEVAAGAPTVYTWISEVDRENGLVKVPVGAELENKRADESSFPPDRNENIPSSEIVEVRGNFLQ